MPNSKRACRLFPRPVQLAALVLVLLGTVLTLATPLRAQSTPASNAAPDVLVFTNGDQLTGKLLHVVDGTVTFHSDSAGDISVPWSKIKSLHTSEKFAVVQQGQKLTRKTPDSEVPQGTLALEDQQLHVSGASGAEKAVPVNGAQYVIDEDTYTKQLHGHPGWRQNWVGSVTAGAALVQATQTSRSFTSAVTAVRAVPNVAWLSPRNRSTFDFNSAYGSVSQPNTVTTKTNILHGDAEQDWYLSPRAYFLVDASFDRNYSQGLTLQQIYGAGFGYTLIKDAKQELDLKVDGHYERQTFGFTPGVTPQVATPSKDLIGADFGDTYSLKMAHGLLFNQGLMVTPAFNNVNAFSAMFNAGLVFPVYKRISFTVAVLDNFLNDPAVGSKKNSFQFTGGLTYTF